MGSRTVIESEYLQAKVSWATSVNSNTIQIAPGRTYSIYVDKDFTGTKVFIESWVEYPELPADGALAAGEGRWVRRTLGGTDLEVATSADNIEYVPAEAFSGVSKIRLVADVAQACTGLVLINT